MTPGVYEDTEHSELGTSLRLGILAFHITWLLTAIYSCAVIVLLVSSFCAPWQLDYISTKLAHCLDINSTMLWGFMYCIQFQTFVLLTTWHRVCARHDCVYNFKTWIVSFGVCFVVSFCMVLEFRNDGNLPTRNFFFLPQMKESSLHVYAAVNTMLSFSLLHVLMASSLLVLSAHTRAQPHEDQSVVRRPKAVDFRSRNQDTTQETNMEMSPVFNCLCAYVGLDVIYALMVVMFICLYLVNVAKLTAFTMAIEWAVGIVAICLHMCALGQSRRLLDLSCTEQQPTRDVHWARSYCQSRARTAAICRKACFLGPTGCMPGRVCSGSSCVRGAQVRCGCAAGVWEVAWEQQPGWEHRFMTMPECLLQSNWARQKQRSKA